MRHPRPPRQVAICKADDAILGMCKNAMGVECAPKCVSELCLWDRATDSLRRQQQPCPWDGTSDAGSKACKSRKDACGHKHRNQ